MREGGRVVHRYLGPSYNPEMEKKASLHRHPSSLPDEFRKLIWDARSEDIHLRRNAACIIERVLELGGMAEMNWLQGHFPDRRILQVFSSQMKTFMQLLSWNFAIQGRPFHQVFRSF